MVKDDSDGWFRCIMILVMKESAPIPIQKYVFSFYSWDDSTKKSFLSQNTSDEVENSTKEEQFATVFMAVLVVCRKTESVS